MGCDGGTIPRRDEMVKLKKKAEKAGREAELAAIWKHCALSGEELKKPIVACELGRLYNKESLLMALLDKPSLPEMAKHIRSLRDVVELQFTPNPAYKPAAVAMAEATQDAEFVCPVSGLEMSGRHRFVFFRSCGCVLSERALKEVPSETCYKCGRGYSKEGVVVLNGSEEEVKGQREAMEQRRQDAKRAKLEKGKRKREALTAAEPSSDGPSPEEPNGPPKEKRVKTSEEDQPQLETTTTKGGVSGPSNGSDAKSNASGPGNGTKGPKGATKARKETVPRGMSKYSRSASAAAPSSKVGSKLGLGAAASSIVMKTTDEMESSYKPPAADPDARDAYKSLFQSTSKKRPKEKTSNWVTFFPYH